MVIGDSFSFVSVTRKSEHGELPAAKELKRPRFASSATSNMGGSQGWFARPYQRTGSLIGFDLDGAELNLAGREHSGERSRTAPLLALARLGDFGILLNP